MPDIELCKDIDVRVGDIWQANGNVAEKGLAKKANKAIEQSIVWKKTFK